MKRYKLFLITAASGFFIFTASAAKLPEKIRVLSCDLAAAAPSDLSSELKALLDKADPDVVFLQHAADWEACDQICKLRPGLRVHADALQALGSAGFMVDQAPVWSTDPRELRLGVGVVAIFL